MKGVTPSPAIEAVLARLNPQQRQAATHDDRPLLIVAGAGTGKTATLVQRVAWLIARGVEPSRILLLTFTRRAAAEMLRRVDSLLRHLAAASESPSSAPRGTQVWGGTFHAVATRLLRRYGKAIGLAPNFTIHDRTDSEDLLNVVRTELGLAKTDKRFPKKGTCMAIYSRCVNARERLEQTLAGQFSWCRDWADELKRLLDGYVDRKEAAAVLDYDDLLLYWHALLADPQAGPAVRKQFDCVLVDEYQDTNALQAEILYLLSPEGKGLTVVGDDAQSIYSFRAADGPQHPRLSQALSRRHAGHAGAELSQHAADPRGRQPRDRPGPRAVHQEPLVGADGGPAAGAGHLRGRRRPDGIRDPPHPRASRRGASTCGARRCSSAPRTTAFCWRPSWPPARFPFTSTAV